MKKFILSILLTTFLAAGIFATPVYVCVGSFVNIDNAMALADSLKNDNEDVCISEFLREDGTLFYRVLLNTNSNDLDKAREEADSAPLSGAFILVPKPEDKITVLHKANNAVPKTAPAEPTVKSSAASQAPLSLSVSEEKPEVSKVPDITSSAPVSSPVTLKSGAKKIISSIADMGVFIIEGSEIFNLKNESTTELDELEDLMDFFLDLADSDEIEESKSGRLVTASVKSVTNKFQNFINELDENQKAVISIDENITSDFSDLVPGLNVKTLYLKGNGEVTGLKDKSDYLYGIKGKANGAAALEYTFDLTDLPYRTFIRQMKGKITAQASAAGTFTETYKEVPASAAISLRQEVALCNRKGRGGVVLLEGNISLKGTLTDYYLEIIDSGNIKEMARALDDIVSLNLTLNVYDDDGKLHYMSSLKSFETIAVFLEDIDRVL